MANRFIRKRLEKKRHDLLLLKLKRLFGARQRGEGKMRKSLFIAVGALVTYSAFGLSDIAAQASSHHGNRAHGCFVTTSRQAHARGIRHWVNPCPHTERKHMNPYHRGFHKSHH